MVENTSNKEGMTTSKPPVRVGTIGHISIVGASTTNSILPLILALVRDEQRRKEAKPKGSENDRI